MSSQHFTDAELDCPHCGERGAKQETFDLLEDIRSRTENHYGIGRVRITVASGYRCPAHNAAVGGATKSQHLLGNAADIVVEIKQDRGKGQFEWTLLAPYLVEPIALESPLIGGLGRSSRPHTYTHVDVRPRINGQVTKWCYDSNNKQVAYFAPKMSDEKAAVTT